VVEKADRIEKIDKQGRSGLGLESQRKAIEDFCVTEVLNLRDTYVEVETGKGARCAGPATAAGGRIAYRLDVSCAHHRGPARSFEQGCPFHFQPDVEKVPFVVTALGKDVDPFMLHIYAAVAKKNGK
jgi:hypothetical protein